jgi:Fe-S cluster assembly scaffold protein SufB
MRKKNVKLFYFVNEKNIDKNIIINKNVDLFFLILANNSNKKINIKTIHNSNTSTNIHVNCICKNSSVNINFDCIAKKKYQNIELHQYINGVLIDKNSEINITPSLLVDTNTINISHEIKLGGID